MQYLTALQRALSGIYREPKRTLFWESATDNSLTHKGSQTDSDQNLHFIAEVISPGITGIHLKTRGTTCKTISQHKTTFSGGFNIRNKVRFNNSWITRSN